MDGIEVATFNHQSAQYGHRQRSASGWQPAGDQEEVETDILGPNPSFDMTLNDLWAIYFPQWSESATGDVTFSAASVDLSHDSESTPGNPDQCAPSKSLGNGQFLNM